MRGEGGNAKKNTYKSVQNSMDNHVGGEGRGDMAYGNVGIEREACIKNVNVPLGHNMKIPVL